MARKHFRGARRFGASRRALGAGLSLICGFAEILLSSIPQPAMAQQLWQASAGVYQVTSDPGGNIADRVAQIEQLRRQGAAVQILGACMSSCTMYLGLPQTCVSRQARLGFHGPSSATYGIALTPDMFEHWSRVIADYYPEPLRSWYLREGRNQTMGFTEIRGAELIRMGVHECLA